MKRRIPTVLVALVISTTSAGADVVWSGLDGGIWRIHAGGTADARLSLTGLPELGDQGAPALSPDGSKLALEVTGAGVWICELDDSQCEQISNLPGIAARPAWNPQTGELVFTVYRLTEGVEDSDLWVAGSDLAKPSPLVTQTGSQDDPDISPDGRTLVYASAQTVHRYRAAPQVVRHLWTMDLVTGSARPLVAGAFQDIHPDWSPDGTSIAFASNRSGQFEIWVLSAAGGEPRQVTSGEGSKSWPAWSPDGEFLLFARLLAGRSTLMEVAAAGGSEPRPFQSELLENDSQMRDPEWR